MNEIICPETPGFFGTIWKHLTGWAAEYTVLILTFVSVYLAAEAYYFLTGRRPQEDLEWLVQYSARCIQIALAITFTSMCRQAFGVWYKKEELLDRPVLVVLQTISSLGIFGACLYVLSH